MTTSQRRLDEWFRDELPRLNRAVLHGGADARAVADGLATVLPDLPDPDAMTAVEAHLLVIDLGLAGSSVARHYQEQDAARKQHPEQSFEGLYAGPGRLPFRDYFADVAARTGTGHCGRDAYASLVLWNVPTTSVRFRGRTLATLPGPGGDQRGIRSYTADPGEAWFFELVKRGQTLERAANLLLEPLTAEHVELTSDDALRRVRLATTLLEALRQLFVEFAAPTAGPSMTPHYFMDVFRQFAVAWTVGDVPPSGALDIDAVKRDFLLGTVNEPYRQHVARIRPAMLTAESAGLDRVAERPSLPDRLLSTLGLDRARLIAHPAVGDWYRLLSAHSRAAGGHLMLSKRFLFNPQRHRDETGVGDKELVSNRRGTTGMDESILDRLTRMRREHPLADLRGTVAAGRLPVDEITIDAGPASDGGAPVPTPRRRRAGQRRSEGR